MISSKPLKVGGCYVYEIKKDSFLGLFVVNTRRHLKKRHYYILISGSFFTTIPSKAEFIAAGVWGRVTPHISDPDYDSVGFYTRAVDEDLFVAAESKMILVDTLEITSEIIGGDFGFSRSFEEIPVALKAAEIIKIKEVPEYKSPPLKVYPIPGVTIN
jgi:hypothetical protein